MLKLRYVYVMIWASKPPRYEPYLEKMVYKIDDSVVFVEPGVIDDLNERILFQFSLNSAMSAQSYLVWLLRP